MLQHVSGPKLNINDKTSQSHFLILLTFSSGTGIYSYLPEYPAPPSYVRGSGIGALGTWCRRHPATSYSPNYPLSAHLPPTSHILFTSVSDPSKHVERSLDINQPLHSPTGPRGLIMPPKFKGPKLPKIPICQTPETVPVPENLDKHTTITINDQKFDIEADDLEVICELGEFCKDIWLQMRQIAHKYFSMIVHWFQYQNYRKTCSPNSFHKILQNFLNPFFQKAYTGGSCKLMFFGQAAEHMELWRR